MIKDLFLQMKLTWCMGTEPFGLKVFHRHKRGCQSFEVKIWIYWFESNSWIYFYIPVYLNKKLKNLLFRTNVYWSWARGPVLIGRTGMQWSRRTSEINTKLFSLNHHYDREIQILQMKAIWDMGSETLGFKVFFMHVL